MERETGFETRDLASTTWAIARGSKTTEITLPAQTHPFTHLSFSPRACEDEALDSRGRMVRSDGASCAELLTVWRLIWQNLDRINSACRCPLDRKAPILK